ncbi:MAG: tRNA (guanine-N(7)-)-methyltransferase TrmB [Saliniramus fredricksonii]|uniref:tRNA (guanine-N(7)-)-methyltransferase n=1 Tax=Saliniramus fredricksonii TaxID=1653334 RepID=A0A0P7XB26_9HYPH|nr:tRNA (guanine(46)-N(7))-methyltransferase TrmB [Saliniramus fredricksonii]KPQ12532.1 MAG: tRNA (guanine-N(7)-)-methyltransferase TrmB [Saliniramus fredricksonii]SCC82792.1 tRNA (guanine-N7-)-methyltransferase [Saliniramus fredricksonii]
MSAPSSDAQAPAASFFGRRKGKRLRAGQEERLETLLPRLILPRGDTPLSREDLAGFFGFMPEELVLEIGFGGGEHLAHRAGEAPKAGFIGCEPFINGMVKLLGEVEARDLHNIRLWDADAGLLLPRLPEAAFSRIYLLYPDPWPKRRTRKRRFVSKNNLAAIARLLQPGGRFHFASDIDDYVGWTLAQAAQEPRLCWLVRGPDDWRDPYPGWPGTRYEAKAVREGRRPSYLTFARV